MRRSDPPARDEQPTELPQRPRLVFLVLLGSGLCGIGLCGACAAPASRDVVTRAGDGSTLEPSPLDPRGAAPVEAVSPSAPAPPATPVAPGPPAEDDGSGWLPPIHGQLFSRFRLRDNGDESDYELYEILSLDVGDPASDLVTGRFMGRATFDLDGGGDQDFYELPDTYDGAVTGQLYYLYADYHGSELLPTARLGRQQIADTPEIVSFDGARLATRPLGDLGVEVGAYGGVPVHFYESSPSGDSVFGTWVEARPWKGGRARADWMHLEDEQRLGSFDDDLLGLELWQEIERRLFLEASYSRLESNDRDVRAAARWSDPDSAFMLQASYYELLEPLQQLVNELDPYYQTLLTYYPYRQLGLLASQGLGEAAHLQAGLDLRRVSDEEDVGEFNRDYDRAFGALALHQLFGSGFELSLSGDWWDSDDQDISGLGFELGHDLGTSLDLALGSYYSLYKYDLFLVSEREDVRCWYLRGRWKRTQNRTLELTYEYEDADFEDYHTLRVEAAWRF